MKILEQYDQYIKGTLKEEELDSFTRKIIKEHFEKEKLQKRWNQMLQEGDDSHESAADEQKVSNKRSSLRFLKIILSTAATVLIAVFAWWTIQPSSTEAPYERLLSQELSAPYVESITRKGDDMEEIRLQAAAAYNSREYTAALAYFEQLNRLDEKVDWDFYIGLCQLYQGQADQAIQSFNTILNDPSGKFNKESNWYLAVAYIINKDFDSAKKYLEVVMNRSDNESTWKEEEAEAFLKVINEM